MPRDKRRRRPPDRRVASKLRVSPEIATLITSLFHRTPNSVTVPPKHHSSPRAQPHTTSTPTQQNTGAATQVPERGSSRVPIDDCSRTSSIRPQHSATPRRARSVAPADRTSHDVVGLMHARGRKRVSTRHVGRAPARQKQHSSRSKRRIRLRAMRSRASAAAGDRSNTLRCLGQSVVSWRTTRQTPAGLTPGLSPMRSRAVCFGSRTKAIVHVMWTARPPSASKQTRSALAPRRTRSSMNVRVALI